MKRALHRWIGNFCRWSVVWARARLRPSREFLEKFKIIFFSNFSRNYFREIREIRENRFKVIFVFWLHFSRFVPKFFRIPTTFDSISSLISIDANFVYIYVFLKVILTEIHYRCQFYLNFSSHFSSQNTKSIKKPWFLFLEFLENFSRN